MDKVAANCSSCIVNRRTISKSVCDAELVLIYRPIGLWISEWLTPRLCGGPTRPSLSSDDGAEVDGATKTESFCATVVPTETWKMKNENLHITRWAGFFRYCAKRIFYSRCPANDHGKASASERKTCFVKSQTRISLFLTKRCLVQKKYS